MNLQTTSYYQVLWSRCSHTKCLLEEAAFKLRLTHIADGCTIGISILHMLAGKAHEQMLHAWTMHLMLDHIVHNSSSHLAHMQLSAYAENLLTLLLACCNHKYLCNNNKQTIAQSRPVQVCNAAG